MSNLRAGIIKVLKKPYLSGVYNYLRLINAARQDSLIAKAVLNKKFNSGFCPICEKKVLFVRKTDWLRDNYYCVSCFSIPRQRAIIKVLEAVAPNWREMTIHESASGGLSSDKIKSECANYTSSFYMKDVPSGTSRNGVRSENLEKMTFAAESFDIFITQDVFEHVLNPDLGFREVARVLKPNGIHIFTIPLYQHEKSLVRAVPDGDEIKYLVEPDYHGDPATGDGWLVVTEWGHDFPDFIQKNGGMKTDIHLEKDVKYGLDGEFLEVFVSKK